MYADLQVKIEKKKKKSSSKKAGLLPPYRASV
jgi:hypothetical protein